MKKSDITETIVAAGAKRVNEVFVSIMDGQGSDTVERIKAAAVGIKECVSISAAELVSDNNLQLIKDTQTKGNVLIITGVGKSSEEYKKMMGTLIADTLLGTPTWLHPDTKVLLISYEEDIIV